MKTNSGINVSQNFRQMWVQMVVPYMDMCKLDQHCRSVITVDAHRAIVNSYMQVCEVVDLPQYPTKLEEEKLLGKN